MKKSAFSYLELIICMSLVTAVVMLSMPLSTQNRSTNDIYGEFRCYSEYNPTYREYRLYQQQRFNSSALSEKRDVSDTGCVFTRPAGVSTFTITAIGGGGGGSKPVVPPATNREVNQVADIQTENIGTRTPLTSASYEDLIQAAKDKIQYSGGNYYYERSNASGWKSFKTKITHYILKTMQRGILLYPGAGGEQGEIVTKTSTLANSFSENEIVIYHCQNAEIPSTNGAEYNFCVGKGGEAGIGQDLKSYYTIIGVIQDMARYKNGNSTFANYGNNSLYANMNLIRKSTKDNNANTQAYIKYRTFYYDASNTSKYNSALETLKTFVRNNNNLETDIFSSHGYNGHYTRFKLDKNDNLVAQGGKGGSIKTGIEQIFKNSANIQHVISGYYYTRKGENGKFNEKIEGGSGGIGGNCICQGNACQNCDGLSGTRIGSGGGGGSIVFNTNQKLEKHHTVSFVTSDGAQLNSFYDVTDNTTAKQDLTLATSISAVNNNTFYAGNGGNGAGGAIIINW